jgi:hypothetical protein
MSVTTRPVLGRRGNGASPDGGALAPGSERRCSGGAAAGDGAWRHSMCGGNGGSGDSGCWSMVAWWPGCSSAAEEPIGPDVGLG